MGDEPRPERNDEGMSHTALSIARPDLVRYREWVLRNNTARTRRLRQAVRETAQISPLALVTFVVLPFSWLTGVAMANGLRLVIAIERMLDRIIDGWLSWQDEREARRREHWKRNMHRDQWLGIW
jgi:hypothetical protein